MVSLVCAVRCLLRLLPLSIFFSPFSILALFLTRFLAWCLSFLALCFFLSHSFRHSSRPLRLLLYASQISIVCLHWAKQTTLKINHLPSKKHTQNTHTTRPHGHKTRVCMNKIFETPNKTLFGIANDIDTTLKTML